MNVFHTADLNKEGAIALARRLGLRRDWARVRLAEIQTALRGFPADRLANAARELPEFFDADDLAALTDESKPVETRTSVDHDDHDDLPTVPAKVKVDTAPKPTPRAETKAEPTKSPDVTQVATLLAQLLATGKAGLDADEVRGIVAPMIDHQAQAILNATQQVIETAIKGIPSRELTVKTERGEFKLEGVQHHQFENLLHMCGATTPDGNRLNVWLYGPPGTGKTTAAKHAAKALGLPFYCNGALSTKYELIGFIDAGGKLQRTPFREAWENGGLYLFDEIDGSDPKAVVAFNSALANGVMAFPDGMVERHPDCVMIAASNTVHGATSEFTGRMKLDAATIDRFIFLEWDIDERVEQAMCPIASWVDTVQAYRRKIKDKGVKVQITPRATLYGASLLRQGLPLEFVKTVTLRKAMTADQWKLIEA